MKASQLNILGVPPECIPAAMKGVQCAVRCRGGAEENIQETIQRAIGRLVENPGAFLGDECWKALAESLLDFRNSADCIPSEPLAYPTWGGCIGEAAHEQMKLACQLPVARAGALMPDAHMGYGLPIGGVLAVENAVIPYAVGVDIACRMKLSILDIEPEEMASHPDRFENALQRGTRFGMGVAHETPQDHPVMDRDWSITPITREKKDTAHRQLGTSGSGNHFVEFGTLSLSQPNANLQLPPGVYTALLSHSGSRGAGASVCSVYSKIASVVND
jgi:tRNA-splicing ligase RtcB